MPDSEGAVQGESVDRIRDIIFGPKMRDYEQRFEALVRDVGRLQGEIDRLGEQLTSKDAAQAKAIQGLRHELRQANGELRSEMKGELGRLGSQMTEQNAAQTTSLGNLRQDLNRADSDLLDTVQVQIEGLSGQMGEQDAAHRTQQETLRQELRKADAELREELRQIAQRLTDDKTDRSTLGELFIELGQHVKTGGSLTDLLKDLGQPG
jgi:type VI protein secretion system component VasK